MKETERECCVPINAETVQKLADFTDECLTAAQLPAARANKLRIAADEVAANIASYSGAAQAVCRFAARDGAVTLTFADDGTPFDPLRQAGPGADTTAPADERPLGGLGLLLVKRLTDDVTYRYSEGKNILTLKMSVYE